MKNIENILFIFAVETAKIGCARHNAQAAAWRFCSRLALSLQLELRKITCEKEK